MALVIVPIIMPQVTLNFRGHTPKHPRTQGCVTISIRVPHMGLVISPTIIPQVTLNRAAHDVSNDRRIRHPNHHGAHPQTSPCIRVCDHKH